MRKLIVKYFALDYIFKAFGSQITITRSSTFIYPLFALTGILYIKGIFITIPILLIVLFLGFIYFRIKPVSFSELDFIQKYTYSQAVANKIIQHEMNNEFLNAMQEYHEKVEIKRFYNPFCFFIFHPLFQCLFWVLVGYYILTN